MGKSKRKRGSREERRKTHLQKIKAVCSDARPERKKIERNKNNKNNKNNNKNHNHNNKNSSSSNATNIFPTRRIKTCLTGCGHIVRPAIFDHDFISFYQASLLFSAPHQ